MLGEAKNGRFILSPFAVIIGYVGLASAYVCLLLPNNPVEKFIPASS
ncbi:MAG TPA: hypothetical protein VGC22_03925 [Chitinophaga sp.]